MRERGKAAPLRAYTPVRSHAPPELKINKIRGLRAILHNTATNGLTVLLVNHYYTKVANSHEELYSPLKKKVEYNEHINK